VEGAGASTGAAFGDTFAAAPAALQTVAYDDYERLYQVNLGAAWRSAARPDPLPAAPLTGVTSSVVHPLGGGGAVRVVAFAGAPERVSTTNLSLAAGRGPQATAVSLAKGALRLDLWSGHGGLQPTFDGAPADAFTTLAGAGQAMRAGVAVGRWTFSAESGAGVVDPLARLDLLADPEASRAPSRYGRAVAAFAGEGWGVSLGAGALSEPAGPLGSVAPASSRLSMPAESRFTSVSATWLGLAGVRFSGDAAFGRTEASGPMIALAGARTSSWSVAADVACARLGLDACDGLTVGVSQPLRIEAGEATTTLADVPLDYSDPITFSRRTLSLAPSGREIDLSLGVHRALGPGGLRVQASALLAPGHRADAPVAYGLSAAFHTRF
jgi:hypothetical protein